MSCEVTDVYVLPTPFQSTNVHLCILDLCMLDNNLDDILQLRDCCSAYCRGPLQRLGGFHLKAGLYNALEGGCR